MKTVYVQSAAEKPGDGQQQVVRSLLDNKKLLRAEDAPLSPRYVRDQTPLKRGEIMTAELRGEFRKDPRLPMMIGDDAFMTCGSGEGRNRLDMSKPAG